MVRMNTAADRTNDRILLVEDDPRLAEMLVEYVLLDLMLPDADGLDVCRQIRALAAPLRAIPIVMLTAKGDPFDRVVGLEIGADDYLPKPFEPRELLARCAPCCAAAPLAGEGARARVLRFGRLEIDPARAPCGSTAGARADRLPVRPAAGAGRARRPRAVARAADRRRQGRAARSLRPFDRRPHRPPARRHRGRPKQPRRIVTVRGAGYVFAKVQDILLASRLDAVADDTELEEVDLLALAAEECARYDGAVLEGESAVVNGDPRLLRRLLRNLLENAHRHGIPPAQVRIANNDGMVKLAVWDLGHGIPETEYERVFEPFYRRRATRDNSGAGLGLALVRQIARRHGGEARCAMMNDGRSSFEITLPLKA
jgi:signal transduction histidine kinase